MPQNASTWKAEDLEERKGFNSVKNQVITRSMESLSRKAHTLSFPVHTVELPAGRWIKSYERGWFCTERAF